MFIFKRIQRNVQSKREIQRERQGDRVMRCWTYRKRNDAEQDSEASASHLSWCVGCCFSDSLERGRATVYCCVCVSVCVCVCVCVCVHLAYLGI